MDFNHCSDEWQYPMPWEAFEPPCHADAMASMEIDPVTLEPYDSSIAKVLAWGCSGASTETLIEADEHMVDLVPELFSNGWQRHGDPFVDTQEPGLPGFTGPPVHPSVSSKTGAALPCGDGYAQSSEDSESSFRCIRQKPPTSASEIDRAGEREPDHPRMDLGASSSGENSITNEYSPPRIRRRYRRSPKETPAQSHEMIEKRYRKRLDDRMVQLKKTVPTLRASMKGTSATHHESLEFLEPARNLRKHTVLEKTIEYIQHLERCLENIEGNREKSKAPK